MDTKPLERFATWARRELINAVDAQATSVLAVGSVARSERAEVVKKLEAEIAGHGRQHVVDKVAYTWFNRIVALRLMDARGYTDAGVVSPAQGQTHGQPEILSDAKRGNLDTDVITNRRTADAIIGLLDGSRRSTDAEGEAYALLLTEYCRYWHKPMPFMFEREGDYTELLVPANLLADGAILARAREVLTEDVCDDVEVIGWLYQFYISERKDEVFAGFKKNKKAGADEIPAATQLFTPHWIVRYLVENSLGRLWMLNRPTSRLVDQMQYYVAPVDEEIGYLKVSTPEDLRVIDPACGSGHMLTYAFDLLYTIYEEEGYGPSEIPGLILVHNLHGTEIDPRAGSLAAFALTMKARAKQRTLFSKRVAPNICVIEPISFEQEELDILVARGGERDEGDAFWNQFNEADTLGSLIQAESHLTSRLAEHLNTLSDRGDMFRADTLRRATQVVRQAAFLTRRYSVAVVNPPYMGSGNMSGPLAAWLKRNYPSSRYDLMTAFMIRAASLCLSGGLYGMINLPSWMFLSSYVSLRAEMLSRTRISSLLHLGRGIYGSDFGSVAFVICNRPPGPKSRGIYRRLFDTSSEVRSNAVIEARFQERSRDLYEVAQSELKSLPGAPIAYWLSDAMRAAFAQGTLLKNAAKPRTGMNTGHNERFLREWWEVDRGNSLYNAANTDEAHESGLKWFPYNKGGEFRRWYGNGRTVISFDRQNYAILAAHGNHLPSRQHYFEPSVTWSKVSSGEPAFRLFSQGAVFDGAGASLFADDNSQRIKILGFLNSTVATSLLSALAPTLNVQSGDIAELPLIESSQSNDKVVEDLVYWAKRDWDDFEVSWDFMTPSWMKDSGSGKSVVQTQLAARFVEFSSMWAEISRDQQEREIENHENIADVYGLRSEVSTSTPLHRVSLARNVKFSRGQGRSDAEYESLQQADFVAELISYSVGCMFGRFSLDKPGLILADHGTTLQDYLAKIPSPMFQPDADNVIPFVDDGWFEDDIVERFRVFLRTAFGANHFSENLSFVEEVLGVKTLRDYFMSKAGKSKFYEDHVQRYKKRPIYWMFSSPEGSFNALIYMHRYTSATVSTVLNEYLREYRAKLEVALVNAEEASGGSAKEQKEADRLRKVLVELAEYEHDVLYPLATQQIVIDLDDGVKVNYPKFYPALKSIAGLEASE